MIVFDVDDTVTRGTTDIKLSAWDVLFSDKLDLMQEARELYEYTGNGDRYNIIAHVIGESQEGCKDNVEVQKWADKFEEITQKYIREQGIHSDDLAALIELRDKFDGPIYLLSATPQLSVAGNVEYFESIHPDLRGIFSGVIGTPMNGGKAGELKILADKHNLDTDELVMIGDGGSDYVGADGSGTQFIAIVSEDKLDKWPDENFPKLKAISELLHFFE